MCNDMDHLALRVQSLQSDNEKLTETVKVMAGALKRLDRYMGRNEQWLHGVMEGTGDRHSLTPQKLARCTISRAKAHRRS